MRVSCICLGSTHPACVRACGASAWALAHVPLSRSQLQHQPSAQTWYTLRPSGGSGTHAVFNSKSGLQPPELCVQLQILKDTQQRVLKAETGAASVATLPRSVTSPPASPADPYKEMYKGCFAAPHLEGGGDVVASAATGGTEDGLSPPMATRSRLLPGSPAAEKLRAAKLHEGRGGGSGGGGYEDGEFDQEGIEEEDAALLRGDASPALLAAAASRAAAELAQNPAATALRDAGGRLGDAEPASAASRTGGPGAFGPPGTPMQEEEQMQMQMQMQRQMQQQAQQQQQQAASGWLQQQQQQQQQQEQQMQMQQPATALPRQLASPARRASPSLAPAAAAAPVAYASPRREAGGAPGDGARMRLGGDAATISGMSSEVVVQVQLPPAPVLAMLLQLTADAASLVEPWLRWAGVEARCLPLQHGRWQVCLRLAGPLPTVLAALQSRDASEPPLLLLRTADAPVHDGAGGTPLAVTALPMERLHATESGASMDTQLELRAPQGAGGGGGGGGAAARALLGVRVRVRERAAAELEARDGDAHVHFTLRLRLHSLTLLRGNAAATRYTRGSEAECELTLRLRGYPGMADVESEPVRCRSGQPVDLDEELSLLLPNPPYSPKAALELLQRQPLRLELLLAQPGSGGEPVVLAAAAVQLHEVCGGALVKLPATPQTPIGHVAAATAPVQRCVELLPLPGAEAEAGGAHGDGVPPSLCVARVQLGIALQCTYTHADSPPPSAPEPQLPASSLAPRMPARAFIAPPAGGGGDGAGPSCDTGAVRYTHAPAASLGSGGAGAHSSAPSLRYRFVIAVRTARDVALPLGSCANVFVRFSYPFLEGAGGQSKVVRSSPPVLLGRHGEVPLPNAAAVFEFRCEPGLLLHKLASEPLLVELWHKDRYVPDLLLGLATVDMAEVLGAKVHGQGQTTREQERAVPVLVPEGPPPAPLAQQAQQKGGAPLAAPGSRVAMLGLLLRLEELGPPPPPPPPTRGLRPATAPSLSAAARGAAAGGASAGEAEAEGALAKWRRREEGRWRAALKEREEESLALLTREWKVREARREEGVAKQRKALLGLEAELRQRVEHVLGQQQQLEHGEEDLAHRQAEAGERMRLEAEATRAATQAEQVGLHAAVAAARAEAQQAEARGEALATQLAAAQAREVRIEEREAAWRDTHTEGAARGLALQHEVARLTVEAERLGVQRDEAAASAEQRKQQALCAHRELQRLRAATAGEGEARLREQLEQQRQANAQLELRREAEGARAALRAEAGELQQLKWELESYEEQQQQARRQQQQQPPSPPPSASLAFSEASHRRSQRAAAASVMEALPSAGSEAEHEVARLRAMCSDFMRSGMYAPTDRVVLLLEEKIKQLQPVQLQLPAY